MPCNPPDLGAVKWLLELVQWFECRHQKGGFKRPPFFVGLMAGVWWMKEKNILFKNFK